MKAQYQPIDCDFHDQLESYSTLKKRVRIEFVDFDDQPQSVFGHIVDIYTQGGAEYLKLNSGVQLRLDQIRNVTIESKSKTDH